MNQVGDKTDEELVERLDRTFRETIEQRRRGIDKLVASGEFDQKAVEVGLKNFHGICDKWAIEESEAKAILFDCSTSSQSDADLLERISYTMRIYRLVNELIQGDRFRQQRWLHRALVPLDGARPIDLMVSGPSGSAKVMRYLEQAKY
jgi:hypothetical protein